MLDLVDLGKMTLSQEPTRMASVRIDSRDCSS
jgi:hypothetical protein